MEIIKQNILSWSAFVCLWVVFHNHSNCSCPVTFLYNEAWQSFVLLFRVQAQRTLGIRGRQSCSYNSRHKHAINIKTTYHILYKINNKKVPFLLGVWKTSKTGFTKFWCLVENIAVAMNIWRTFLELAYFFGFEMKRNVDTCIFLLLDAECSPHFQTSATWKTHFVLNVFGLVHLSFLVIVSCF
jgi:hypothetical protein